MTAEAIANKWHQQFLRTDRIDHAHAEAAVRAVYRSAGMAEPERFLWCASPLAAVWSVLVLVGKTESYNHAVYEDFERSKAGQAKLAVARAAVAEQLGIAEEDVEGHFGKPFYVAEGSNPVTKKLTENFDAWMARAESGDDFLATHRGGPFKPLHDLEESLHYEGYKSRNGASQPARIRQAMLEAGAKHVEILGGRSAHHRLYGGNLAYTEVAVDEALAELGKFVPTELQRALWAAYEACGMWWPCHHGIVFAERPVTVEGSGDDAAMAWSDGFTIGEIKIQSPQPATPTAQAPPETKATATSSAAVLSRPLPRDHGARMAAFREAGSLPLLDRYLAGEHVQVWNDLLALGDKVRSEAHAADALAVAYETMHRVDQNVRILAERLTALGYRFVEPGSRSGLFGLGKPKSHAPHVPPAPDSADRIAELEDVAGGPIPLSLRAFFDVVGAVNFTGEHATLAPANAEGAADPLMVYGVQDAIDCVEGGIGDDEDEDGEPRLYVLAPDALHKANISGGDPYAIALPAPLADALVEGEPHGVNFVDYLRIAIGWGGFPGWQEAGAQAPADLAALRRDLIPF